MRFFTKEANTYHICQEIREMAIFSNQNIVNAPLHQIGSDLLQEFPDLSGCGVTEEAFAPFPLCLKARRYHIQIM